MVCYRYIIVNTLRKVGTKDDDVDDNDQQAISHPRLVASWVVLAGVQT